MAWGGGTFNPNLMNNPLPGTYVNVNVSADSGRLVVSRGYLACPVELPWGLDDEVIEVTADGYEQEALEKFGLRPGDQQLILIEEMLKNAKTLYLYRTNSGLKASGSYGEAKCSGELGNEITIVITEDPDNPGDTQPDTTAAIVKGAGNTYTVAYQDLYTETPDIRVTKAGVSVPRDNNWTQTYVSAGTWTVGILDSMEPGEYKIEAWLKGGEAALTTFDFEILAPPATAEIKVEGKVYTITYTNLYDRESKVTVKDTLKQTDVEQSGNYSIVGSGSQYTVTILDTMLPGSYAVNAELSTGEVLATSSFSVNPPTADIVVTQPNDQYTIDYSDLGAYTAEVKIKDETQDIEEGEKYQLDGVTDHFTVDVNDALPGGTYTLEARAKHEQETKVLDSETITLPKPTAQITETTKGKSYKADFENLRGEKGSLKLKKDGADYSQNNSTDGENPITMTIQYENLEDGEYTVEAGSTLSKEALATAEFSFKTPTAEISEDTANVKYTVTYTGLDSNWTPEVKIKNTGDIEAGTSYTVSDSSPVFTVNINDSLKKGEYTLEARVSIGANKKVIKSQSITIPAPTAEITENTEGESYTVNFTNLRDETGSVKLTKDGSTPVTEPEKISTSGKNPIEVTITKESLEDGAYKLEAFATGTEEALASKEFTKTTE